MRFLTVVTRREFARARVLARSINRHHADAELLVAVFDDPVGEVADDHAAIDLIRLGDLGISIDDYKTLATIYNGFELRRALVPWAMDAAASRGSGPVVVVPPDLWILGPVDELGATADAHGLAVIPRLLAGGRAAIDPGAERGIMGHGVHDDTFFAVSAERLVEVAAWMKRQLSRTGTADGPNLIDQAASYWQAGSVLDPGIGVANWNASYRSLDRSPGGDYLAFGSPVRAVRTVGIDPDRVRNRRLNSTFGSIAQQYVAEIDAAGGLSRRHPEAETDIGSDDVFIHDQVRQVAREQLGVAELNGLDFRLPDPFGELGGRGLTMWAEKSSPRFARTALSTWAVPRAKGTQARGLNIVGFAKSENGVGDMTRLLVEIVEEAGIPYRLFPYSTRGNSREEHPFDLTGDQSQIFDTNIVVLNADWLDMFAQEDGRALLADRPTIGYWAWETEEFPDWMADSDRWADEVWGLSTFTADAIRAKVGVPVQALPLPIRHRPEMIRSDSYAERPYTFFFSFDFNSIYERKNPRGVMDAFTAAFQPGEAELVVKSINGQLFPDRLQDMLDAAARHPDIVAYDGFVDLDVQQGLVSGCDCYVSLHRAEGFGLTVAEAMAYGKPVIVSDYSGSLDFTNRDCAFMVPTDRSTVPIGAQPYMPGSVWGEPDIEAAAVVMRWVRDHPVEAEAVGIVGRDHVRSNHSASARAGLLRELLENFWARTGAPIPAGA